MLTRKNALLLLIAALAVSSANLWAQEPDLPLTPYMGGPVELVEAPKGAICFVSESMAQIWSETNGYSDV
jgi:hypothetical protein